MSSGVLEFFADAADGLASIGGRVLGSADEPTETFPDPLDEPDALEREFRKLEREVRQRECDHEVTVEVTEFGQRRPFHICRDCGAEVGP